MTDAQVINFKQKFQDLRRLEKDLEEKKGRGLLLQELFAGQGWYLASIKHKLLEQRKRGGENLSSSIPLEKIVPSEMDTTLSALEAFAASLPPPSVLVESVPVSSSVKTIPNATINVEVGAADAGKIVMFNALENSFEQEELGNQQVDLLVLGPPEKESHTKAENNFKDEKWLLLGKMLKSMGPERIAFSLGVEFDEQTKEIKHDRFYREYRALKPKLILAIGATASNMLLLKRERLSQIHGQIFSNELQFSDGIEATCFFMPIYHPDFLLINPNMKRATWEDMKLAMLFLKDS